MQPPIVSLKEKYKKMSKYSLLCAKRAAMTLAKTTQGRIRMIDAELRARNDDRDDRR